MKTRKGTFTLLLLFAATAVTALAQPAVTSFILNGQAQTGFDSVHRYLRYSISPGALVYFTVTVSGGQAPLNYQWQWNGTVQSGQTSLAFGGPGTALPAGDYTFTVADAHSLTASQTVTLTVDPTFTKVMTDPIVTVALPHGPIGGTWGDYDNDGFPDLLVFNGLDSVPEPPLLFHNNGNGTFTQVASGPPLGFASQTYSASWGDYDNDGNLDLYLANTSGFAVGLPNLLYHNDGAGVFHQITSGSIVTDSAATLGVAWADYNQDGFLDMFSATFDANASSHCYLYQNNGDGTFSSVTTGPIVTDLGSASGCVWGDYDNDGKIDLFVCGGRGSPQPLAPNRLYHNNGDGTFTLASGAGNIVTDTGYGKACAWGDYDNDGYLDLFVVNGFGLLNFLYHNNGDGTFTRITVGDIATDSGKNFTGCAWGDYDNDGYLDLFVTEEGTSLLANHLYHNNGDGTFTKITTGSPVNEYSDCLGCSWVDYDNDGFLDLFAARGDGRGNYLYHNNLPATGNTNGWLIVKLIGTVSNRSAIGAKVRVKAMIGGRSFWQLRQISGGSGDSGHNELWANFGLGNATNIETVRIEWPSGTVQEFHNVSPRQILTYTEPPQLRASASNGVPQFSLKGGRFMQYDILGSTDLATWLPISTVTITNIDGTVQLTDPTGQSSDKGFYRAVSR